MVGLIHVVKEYLKLHKNERTLRGIYSSILINGNTSRLFALGVATTIGIIASAIQTVTLEFYL